MHLVSCDSESSLAMYLADTLPFLVGDDLVRWVILTKERYVVDHGSFCFLLF